MCWAQKIQRRAHPEKGRKIGIIRLERVAAGQGEGKKALRKFFFTSRHLLDFFAFRGVKAKHANADAGF
jgi:hypothetical protein